MFCSLSGKEDFIAIVEVAITYEPFGFCRGNNMKCTLTHIHILAIIYVINHRTRHEKKLKIEK